MTPKEQTALVYEQKLSGEINGNAIARIVIDKFPNSFTGEVGHEIRKITDDALAHVVHKLTMNGVDAMYIAPFSAGFRSGLSATFTKYATDYAARALRTHHIV